MSSYVILLSILKSNRSQLLHPTFAHQPQMVSYFSGHLIQTYNNKNLSNSNLTATESTASSIIRAEITFCAVHTIRHGHFLMQLNFSRFTFNEATKGKSTVPHCILTGHCTLQEIWEVLEKFGTWGQEKEFMRSQNLTRYYAVTSARTVTSWHLEESQTLSQ